VVTMKTGDINDADALLALAVDRCAASRYR
jgi:hypothetical protein